MNPRLPRDILRCEKLPSLDQWRDRPEHQKLHQWRCSLCWRRLAIWRSARPQTSNARESGPIRFGVDGGSAGDEDDPPGAASARLQALGFVHRRRIGIREKVDKRLCRDRLL